MKKKRVMIQVDEKQLASLKNLQARTGASVSEIVRRAIDLYLKKEGGK
jgi:metal-responsive CopG/Arc/MetJ family transcriptional regulator